MEELIKLVSEKTGLPAAQAKVAVETVLGFIKQRLPEPLAGQLDGLLAGGGAGDMLGGLGDLFGKK
ncbi:MAG: hypothetical protein IT317_14760 [Anaerolineales bacterium]|nr:hypothetical protein [Anaerolineales bacterium]